MIIPAGLFHYIENCAVLLVHANRNSHIHTKNSFSIGLGLESRLSKRIPSWVEVESSAHRKREICRQEISLSILCRDSESRNCDHTASQFNDIFISPPPPHQKKTTLPKVSNHALDGVVQIGIIPLCIYFEPLQDLASLFLRPT